MNQHPRASQSTLSETDGSTVNNEPPESLIVESRKGDFILNYF